MEHALAVEPSKLTETAYTELQHCLDAIYLFLQTECASDPEIAESIRNILSDRPCILYQGSYLCARQVALEFPYNCAPYLYGLPVEFTKKHAALLKLIGVKQRFEVCWGVIRVLGCCRRIY